SRPASTSTTCRGGSGAGRACTGGGTSARGTIRSSTRRWSRPAGASRSTRSCRRVRSTPPSSVGCCEPVWLPRPPQRLINTDAVIRETQDRAVPGAAAALAPAGRHILTQFDDESVVVYQAYRPAIGRFAAEHGLLVRLR